MAWFLGQSLVFLVLAFLLGLGVGWLIWGRATRLARPEPAAHSAHAARQPHTDPVTPAVRPAPSAGLTRVAATSTGAAAATEPVEPVAEPPAEPVEVAPVAVVDDEVDESGAEPIVEPVIEDEGESVDATPEAEVAAPVDEAEPAVVAEPDPVDEPVVIESAEQDEAVTAAAEPEPEPAAEPEPEAVLAEPAPDAELPPDLTPAPATSTTTSSTSDDLRRIEGIGPKISAVLTAAGVRTFQELADIDRLRLTQLLTEGGVKFAPGLATWSEQARLLAEGDEQGFVELTNSLVAGRRR